MVKLDELPSEQGRIELEQLQYFLEHVGGKIELIATGEEMQEATKDKTGGLKIHFKTRPDYELTWDMDNGKPLVTPVVYDEGMGITQLYGKQGSKILTTHMEALGYDDTDELGKRFHWYRLRQQRTGFSRLYPTDVSE